MTMSGPLTKMMGGLALIAGACALVSCGDDDDDSASTSIEATATEFAFDPAAWSVPAGEEFTVDFTNDGSIEHEWAVVVLGDDLLSEDDFTEDKVLFEIEVIDAGTSTSQSFTVDEPGTYQVICALDGHFDAGMVGSLTVG